MLTSDPQKCFLESRTKGDKLSRLQALHPGHGYHHSEVTKQDQWEQRGGSDYSGRIYQNAVGQSYATEILSMGFQRLHKDPIGFAQQDPEYFAFVIKTLRNL